MVRVAKPGLISPSGKTDARVRAARAEQRALETQRAQRRRAGVARGRPWRRVPSRRGGHGIGQPRKVARHRDQREQKGAPHARLQRCHCLRL